MGFGQIFADPEQYPVLKAGIELEIGMEPPSPATIPAPDEWIRRLGTLPLMAQPGEKWLYNTSADVLASSWPGPPAYPSTPSFANGSSTRWA